MKLLQVLIPAAACKSRPTFSNCSLVSFITVRTTFPYFPVAVLQKPIFLLPVAIVFLTASGNRSFSPPIQCSESEKKPPLLENRSGGAVDSGEGGLLNSVYYSSHVEVQFSEEFCPRFYDITSVIGCIVLPKVIKPIMQGVEKGVIHCAVRLVKKQFIQKEAI